MAKLCFSSKGKKLFFFYLPTEDITITNTKSKKNESHIFVLLSSSWKFSVDEINVNLFPFSQSKLNKYKKLRSKNRTQIKKRITKKKQ